jgi:hypothetical protein
MLREGVFARRGSQERFAEGAEAVHAKPGVWIMSKSPRRSGPLAPSIFWRGRLYRIVGTGPGGFQDGGFCISPQKGSIQDHAAKAASVPIRISPIPERFTQDKI